MGEIKEPYKTYIEMYEILRRTLNDTCKKLHPENFCNKIACNNCSLSYKVKRSYANVEVCKITEKVKKPIREIQEDIKKELERKFKKPIEEILKIENIY